MLKQRHRLSDFWGRLHPRDHAVLAVTSFVAVIGAIVMGVAVFGDPSAGAPRSTTSIRPDAAAAAPRVAFGDAAGGFADYAAAGQSVPPQSGFAGPMISVDPTIDQGADPANRSALLPGASLSQTAPGQSGLSRRLGALPPTLDPMPASAESRPAALPRAPLSGLHERTAKGLLPIISPHGETAWRAYARPGPRADLPRVALIVGGLGFNARTTAAAIAELPADVTLSFMPYTQDLQGWIDRARADGHEVLIEIPMESWDPRGEDTGPQALLTSVAASDNVARLESLLGRGAGYLGVMNYLGQRFATSPEASAPIAAALRRRGLALFGNGVGARSALGLEAGKGGLPFAAADRVIDARRDGEAIGEQLLALETLAQRNGIALGVGFAFPVTIEHIKIWSQELSMRGLVLAPASAVIASRMAQQ